MMGTHNKGSPEEKLASRNDGIWALTHVHELTFTFALSVSFAVSLSLPLCLSLPSHLFFSCVAIIPSLTVHFLREWGWANGVLGKAVRQLQAYTISTSNLRGYKECVHVQNSMQRFSLTWLSLKPIPGPITITLTLILTLTKGMGYYD